MSTTVPITTSAVTVTDNGSTVAVSVASSAVSLDVGVVGPPGSTGPTGATGPEGVGSRLYLNACYS